MSFIRNAAGVLVTSVAAIPISVATSIVLARWLSVPDRGFYALLTTFSAVLFLLTQLGWAEAAIYRMRRHGVSPARVFATGLYGNVAITLVVLGACLVLREPISRAFLGEVSARAFVLAAAVRPFARAGRLRPRRRTRARPLRSAQPVRPPAVGGDPGRARDRAARNRWRARRGAGRESGRAGRARRRLRLAGRGALRVRAGLRPARGGASLAYGSSLYLQNLCIHLHERIDLFLLAALGVSALEIGLYAAAVSVVAPLRLVPGAIGTALLPRLAGVSDAEAAELTAAVARQATVLMVALALALVPVGMIAIPLLFGGDYARRGDAVPLAAARRMAALSLSRVLSRYFAAVHRQRALLALRAAALVANVV